MASLTPFCTIVATLEFNPIGKVGTGMRVDVPFAGSATSPHREGERPVAGVDHVTIGADGVQQLDIRVRIGAGRETVAYRAIGRGTDAGGPREVLVFDTAVEELAHLNSAVGVGTGSIDGNQLTLEVALVDD